MGEVMTKLVDVLRKVEERGDFIFAMDARGGMADAVLAAADEDEDLRELAECVKRSAEAGHAKVAFAMNSPMVKRMLASD